MNSGVCNQSLLGVFFSLLLCLAGCAPDSDSPEACALVRKAELPVRFEGNLPIVGIEVNGKNASMVLDTGADLTMVNKTAAALLDLKVDWGQRIGAVGAAGLIERHPAFAASAQLDGGLPMSGHFTVGGLPLHGHESIDGFLGLDVLADFDLDLDLPNDRVVLYQARHCSSHQPALGLRMEELPHLSTVPPGLPPEGLIVVKLDGFLQTALIDTGADGTALARDRALQMGVTDAMLGNDRMRVGIDPTGAAFLLASHRFGSLQVGSAMFALPLVTVIDLPLPHPWRSYEMILGIDYLRAHRLWLSFASSRAYQVFTSEVASARLGTP